MDGYLNIILLFDLNSKIQYFFNSGLEMCKNMLKQNNKLHFIIYDKENEKMEEVELDIYIKERLYSLINEYFENKNIEISNDDIQNITTNYINIYYPKFLKDLYN